MAVSCIKKINTTELTVRILKLYELHVFHQFFCPGIQQFFSPFPFRSRWGITASIFHLGFLGFKIEYFPK
jgi:hypothetical protein